MTASLAPDSLRVGQTATGTAWAHHGPVIHRDTFGPCAQLCCLEFADHVEVTVTADTRWPIQEVD